MSFDCGETTIDKTHDIMIEDSFRDTQIPPKYAYFTQLKRPANKKYTD